MSAGDTILHLFGPGYSGRAVKLRELSIDEDDAAALSAWTEAGTDSKRFHLLATRERVMRMIVAVTDPIHAPPPAEAKEGEAAPPSRSEADRAMDAVRALPAKAWKKVTSADLHDPTSALYYQKLFKVKDDATLQAMCRMEHDVLPFELELIAGKAIRISESQT